jgi:GNAT superfamily N-acetyltransferase
LPETAQVVVSIVHICYLAERPEFAEQLIPYLLEHWNYVLPHETAADRAIKFKAHQNFDALPIAWLAYEGNEALGTAALRTCDLEGRDDHSPWLGGVFVKPSHRKRGIASALCSVVEAKAHALGKSRLFLVTHGQEDFYERLGWQHKEAVTWQGHPCSIMCKVLSAIK